MKTNYLKYRIPYELIYNKLKNQNTKQLNIFIDLLSISRGFFNKNIIQLEIDQYFETKREPSMYIDELKYFLNIIYKNFKSYNPKFIIFYDEGKNEQNKILNKEYKSDRSSATYNFLSDDHLELFRQIKNYYLKNIDKFLERQGLATFINLKEYESDLIPFYIISNNLINKSSFNLILSIDKDLLQTCKFDNTFQAVSVYKRSQSKIDLMLYDNDNALSYIYKNFKRGILTAKYIPLILAIAGDKADCIRNVKGIGAAKAISILTNYKIPAEINEFTKLPNILEPYKKQILNNLKLTDFQKQIYRLNNLTIQYIKNKIDILN